MNCLLGGAWWYNIDLTKINVQFGRGFAWSTYTHTHMFVHDTLAYTHTQRFPMRSISSPTSMVMGVGVAVGGGGGGGGGGEAPQPQQGLAAKGPGNVNRDQVSNCTPCLYNYVHVLCTLYIYACVCILCVCVCIHVTLSSCCMFFILCAYTCMCSCTCNLVPRLHCPAFFAKNTGQWSLGTRLHVHVCSIIMQVCIISL